MTHASPAREMRTIPIDQVDVLNPRARNQEAFDRIAENIVAIGLKKPIVVTPRVGADGTERFLLICGEGRLKAFQLHGETHIPALVAQVNDEDAFLMSLAENIARRKYRPLELLDGIRRLKDIGYSATVIGKKIGLSQQFVSGIITLLQHGEERLLVAVQQGQIPLKAASTIVGAGNDDKAVQSALQDAYETGELRGRHLLEARKLIERRHALGRSLSNRSGSRSPRVMNTATLVREYQTEVERQQVIMRRASLAHDRLVFIVGALRLLMADDNFKTLLRAEQLDKLPKYLGDRIATVEALP